MCFSVGKGGQATRRLSVCVVFVLYACSFIYICSFFFLTWPNIHTKHHTKPSLPLDFLPRVQASFGPSLEGEDRSELCAADVLDIGFLIGAAGEGDPPKPCVMFKRETPSLLTQWVVRLLYFLASKGFVAWEVSLFSDTHTYRGGDSDWSNFGWTMAGKRT